MSSINNSQVKIRDAILKNVPKEVEISRIEYEGPRIAIYTKRPEILVEQSYIIPDIVRLIRKRIVVRSDPSVRVSESEAERLIYEKVTSDAEITSVNFDPTIGEVVIEAKKPGLVIGKNGDTLREIVKSTRWRPRVLRSPPLTSNIIQSIRHYIHSESKERERILHATGERVFRPPVIETDSVRLVTLGGFQEVGRSAILIQSKESSVLLDCGLNPGSNKPINLYPRLDLSVFRLEDLDAVIITHAHLDHCGFVPFLFKYGYDGPVYCTEPTASLTTLLQLDYLDVAHKQGIVPAYDQKDVRSTTLHTITQKYGVVTDVAPDMRLTFSNAGHILGSAILHLHIGEGFYNIVYTGDYKYGPTTLLEPAVTHFPRVETLITESTYGSFNDVMPPRKDVENKFVSVLNETLGKRGKVLIPVPAVGRAQEILMVIDRYMRNNSLMEAPVFIDGMISEATAIHTAYPEYLAASIRDQIFHQGINPFESDYFVNIKHASERQNVINEESCIVLATSGMLEGGPAIEYFKSFAPNENNSIVFVSYQIDGTLGRRVRNGLNEVNIIDDGKVNVIKRNMHVHAIEGFSGHSDRKQLFRYIRNLSSKPDRVIICHGERSKCFDMAKMLRRSRYETYTPSNQEMLHLKG